MCRDWDAGSLSEVLVSGGGHLVPADQAVGSQPVIQDWVLEWGSFDDNRRDYVAKLLLVLFLPRMKPE
ncbi:hypothetical protein AQUCO_00200022v1 [Aquilegia coerulea]|uniref:Uncharacterized protein n=1 Tax=Aquilegia coerulea TaxID=218851 RepID=A0A2G5F187_AQUCA|nr:hypothetical protein AQUCO_00200022v1 [Aquilegia coerulea]